MFFAKFLQKICSIKNCSSKSTHIQNLKNGEEQAISKYFANLYFLLFTLDSVKMAYSILSTFFGYTLYLLIHLGIIGGYQDHQNGLSNARRPNSLASWPKMIPLSIQETSTLEMSSSARYHIEKVQFICSSWPQSPTVTMQKSWVNTYLCMKPNYPNYWRQAVSGGQ